MSSAMRKKILLSALLCLFLVAEETSIEIMLRFPSYLPVKLQEVLGSYYYREDQPSIHFLPECSQYDPELFYTLKPGHCKFSGRYFDTLVKVNSLGVRDDEASLMKPEIIVIGDSSAMGWGVEQHETFADIIQRKTGKKVLNLAVSSYGTAREMKILKRADTSNLKVLIIQYETNDFKENEQYFLNDGALPISAESQYINAQKLNANNYYPGKPLAWLVKGFSRRLKSAFGPTPANTGMDLHQKYFLNALAHSTVPLDKLIVMVLRLPETKRKRPEIGAKTIYLQFPAGREYYMPIDLHMNRKGHEEISKNIIKRLAVAGYH